MRISCTDTYWGAVVDRKWRWFLWAKSGRETTTLYCCSIVAMHPDEMRLYCWPEINSWQNVSPRVASGKFWVLILKDCFLFHIRMFLTFSSILNRLKVVRLFWFVWDIRGSGEIFGAWGKMAPKKWKFRKTLAGRVFSWPIPRHLSHHAAKSVIGCVVWRVDLQKKEKNTYICTLKMHIGFIFHHRVGRHFSTDCDENWHTYIYILLT